MKKTNTVKEHLILKDENNCMYKMLYALQHIQQEMGKEGWKIATCHTLRVSIAVWPLLA